MKQRLIDLGEQKSLPLHIAQQVSHIEVGENIMEAKADIDAKNNPAGYSPLRIAAFHGHLAIAEALIEAKA